MTHSTDLYNLLKRNFVVLLLVCLNFVIGYFSLDLAPIGLDEPFSIFHAQMGVHEIIEKLSGGNNPPLYEILLHFWIKQFGISAFSVRLPSLLFSLITVFFVFKIAEKVSSFNGAVLTVLLFTFSNYSHSITLESRSYSLFLLLSSILVYVVITISENKSHRIRDFAAFSIVGTLLLYTHYFGAFVLLFLSSWLYLVNFRELGFLKKYLTSLLLMGILYFPYMNELFIRFISSSSQGTWLKPTENLGNYHDYFMWCSNESRPLYLIYMIIMYVSVWKYIYQSQIYVKVKSVFLYLILPIYFLIGFSIFFHLPFIWRLTELDIVTITYTAIQLLFFAFFLYKISDNQKNAFFTVSFSFLSVTIFFVTSFIMPIWLDRYLLFTLPFFYIAIAIFSSYLFRSKILVLISFVLVLFMWSSFDVRKTNHQSFVDIIHYVHQHVDESTLIVINPKSYDLNFLYHYNQDIFSLYASDADAMNRAGIYSVYSIEETMTALQKHRGRIVYLDAHSDFLLPNNGIYDYMKRTYVLSDERLFDKQLKVCLFNP